MLLECAHGDAESAPCRLIHQHRSHAQHPHAARIGQQDGNGHREPHRHQLHRGSGRLGVLGLLCGPQTAGQAGKAVGAKDAAAFGAGVSGGGSAQCGTLLLVQQDDHALGQMVGVGDVSCGQGGVLAGHQQLDILFLQLFQTAGGVPSAHIVEHEHGMQTAGHGQIEDLQLAAALRGGAQDEESQMAAITAHASELAELAVEEDEILRCCGPLTAEDRVFLARHPERPHIDETINALFTDFFEQCGDRQCREDSAILGGIARFHGMPVTVIGHRKGSTLEENMACNFGMPGPEGYRKALRLMKQAEKFGRPIITFIDTPGAYPGKEAEERGQGEAIARNLMEMSGLTVPVIAVVTGEGSSGGALALGVANHILMLENAVYSVLSPEGFASILWKDSSRSGEACEIMKLTAQDLYKDGIVEEIIPEPVGGAQRSHAALFAAMDTALKNHLTALCKMSGKALADQRYKKFRQIGEAKRA